MKKFSRTDRLSEQIKRELAHLIQFAIKDPRLQFVSVNFVKLSKDLSYAKIYISSLAQEEAIKQQLDVLTKAKGFLRKHLGQKLQTRVVPELNFVYDTTTMHTNQIGRLIDHEMKKHFLKPDEPE